MRPPIPAEAGRTVGRTASGRPRAVTGRRGACDYTALETAPRDATHWSNDLSHNTVSRIWRAFGLHDGDLLSSPLLHRKVRDGGAIPESPDRRVGPVRGREVPDPGVGSVRLPMRPGQVERRTHDYLRHGSLFAGKPGLARVSCHQRHRAVEFRQFLDTIEAEVPADLDVHLIVRHPQDGAIRNWFARPRFHMHSHPPAPRG